MINNVLYKTLILQKPLHIIFNKMGGFLRDYSGTKYLVLFSSEKDDANFDRTRNLIGLKSGIKHIFSNNYDNYARIKIDSGNDFRF